MNEDEMDRVCDSQCGRIKMHIGFLVGKPEGKKPLGRTGVNGRQTL